MVNDADAAPTSNEAEQELLTLVQSIFKYGAIVIPQVTGLSPFPALGGPRTLFELSWTLLDSLKLS